MWKIWIGRNNLLYLFPYNSCYESKLFIWSFLILYVESWSIITVGLRNWPHRIWTTFVFFWGFTSYKNRNENKWRQYSRAEPTFKYPTPHCLVQFLFLPNNTKDMPCFYMNLPLWNYALKIIPLAITEQIKSKSRLLFSLFIFCMELSVYFKRVTRPTRELVTYVLVFLAKYGTFLDSIHVKISKASFK